MRKNLIVLVLLLMQTLGSMAVSTLVINVGRTEGDATETLRQAIAKAAEFRGKKVIIRLTQGDYHLYGMAARAQMCCCSCAPVAACADSAGCAGAAAENTGLLMSKMKNITFDGGGAYLITHGVIPAFIVDCCKNVTLCNFTLKSACRNMTEECLTVGDGAFRTGCPIAAGAGCVIRHSKKVSVENVNIFADSCPAIIGMHSDNITFSHVCCAAGQCTGSVVEANAGQVRLSGCRGRIDITDSRFEGGRGTAVDISGVRLKIAGKAGNRDLLVEQEQHQFPGLCTFGKGDKVELIDAHTQRCLQTAVVREVRLKDTRTAVLTLDRNVAGAVMGNGVKVLDNVTWMPEVEMSNNHFAHVGARGASVTTRRAVSISHSIFSDIRGNAIMVADGICCGVETTPAGGVTIANNTFTECGSPAVRVTSADGDGDCAMRRAVNVSGNRFAMNGGQPIVVCPADSSAVVNNYMGQSCGQSCGQSRGRSCGRR